MQFDPGKGSGCKASYAQKYDPNPPPRGIDKKQVSVASTILISRNCCCSINRRINYTRLCWPCAQA